MKLLPGSLVLLRKISIYYVLSEMPSFSSKCLCCACSLTPVAICCGLIRCLLKLALWVSCLRSTAWGCRALGLAELNWTGLPQPSSGTCCSSGEVCTSAVGSASCLLHRPLCAFCQPLGLPLVLSGSSGLLLGSLPTLPAILQPHSSTLWRRTSPLQPWLTSASAALLSAPSHSAPDEGL